MKITTRCNIVVVKTNDFNKRVYVKKSHIEGGGNGLFAVERIEKGETLCTYGGQLIDPAEAKYMNPMYIVNFELGKGFKLNGDNEDGDLGHYANAVHPENEIIKQNAKFVFKSNKYLNMRGRFNLIATNRVLKDDEIIVNYGKGYWHTMRKWSNTDFPVKPATAIQRDARAMKRTHRE